MALSALMVRLSKLDNDISEEIVQSEVYEIGKEYNYEN